MREVNQKLELKNEEGEIVYKGQFTIKVAKRSERSSMQCDMKRIFDLKEEDPKKNDDYIKVTEKILNDYFVSIDVEHVTSGEKISNREDLEYVESELVIGSIVNTIAGGEKLGNRIA